MSLKTIIDQIQGLDVKSDNDTITHRPARFIPCGSLNKGEERLTSIVLAIMAAVPEFAAILLKSLGQSVSKRSKLNCFVELTLHKDYKDKTAAERPDGLIVHTNAKNHWVCLVEAKTVSAELERVQISRYISLAEKISSSKGPKVDAILTISNNFVAVPQHHPMADLIPRRSSLKLLHWSWTYVQTQAEILLAQDDFEDSTKRTLISELVFYMRSPNSGVQQFVQMNPEWKEFISKMRSSEKLSARNKSDLTLLANSVGAWHQECRDIALLLSRKVRQDVFLKLSRKHLQDPQARIDDDIQNLLGNSPNLSCEIEVPNAAAPVSISVNMNGILEMSMIVDAPSEKHKEIRVKTRFNWLIKQLGNEKLGPLKVQTIGSRNSQNSKHIPYSNLLSDLDECIKHDVPSDPVKFKIIWQIDMASNLLSRKGFITCIEDALQPFYENVVEKIKKYQPSVPEMKTD